MNAFQKESAPKGSVFVTGGAGYIGSHTCLELLESGYRVVIFDDLSNSSAAVVDNIANLTSNSENLEFEVGDILHEQQMSNALKKYDCHSVIHFAGWKSVAESQSDPLGYFENNSYGLVCLLRAMRSASATSIVFSSSATVYGEPDYLPYDENHPCRPINNYGFSKHASEMLLGAQVKADKSLSATSLRYFNPVGAHPSGLLGERPNGRPNNLMPYLLEVAIGLRPHLDVFGSDYDTRDGTGVRDYLHVCDIARAHVLALEHQKAGQHAVYNLGSGQGHSVLEVVEAFHEANDVGIPYHVVPRRAGDLPEYYADASLAQRELGWTAERSLVDSCRDAWKWGRLTLNTAIDRADRGAAARKT